MLRFDPVDEEDLRFEILNLKKHISRVCNENGILKVKIRKLQDEMYKRDKQLDQFLDPKKLLTISKLFRDKGASMLLHLRAKNHRLEQLLLEKDLTIRRLQNNLHITKIYSQHPTTKKFVTKSTEIEYLEPPKLDIDSGRPDSTENKAESEEKLSKDMQNYGDVSVDDELNELVCRNSSTGLESETKAKCLWTMPNAVNKNQSDTTNNFDLPESDFTQSASILDGVLSGALDGLDADKSKTDSTYDNLSTTKKPSFISQNSLRTIVSQSSRIAGFQSPDSGADAPHEEIKQLHNHFLEMLTEIETLKNTIEKLQTDQMNTDSVLKEKDENILKLASEVERLRQNKRLNSANSLRKSSELETRPLSPCGIENALEPPPGYIDEISMGSMESRLYHGDGKDKKPCSPRLDRNPGSKCFQGYPGSSDTSTTAGICSRCAKELGPEARKQALSEVTNTHCQHIQHSASCTKCERCLKSGIYERQPPSRFNHRFLCNPCRYMRRVVIAASKNVEHSSAYYKKNDDQRKPCDKSKAYKIIFPQEEDIAKIPDEYKFGRIKPSQNSMKSQDKAVSETVSKEKSCSETVSKEKSCSETVSREKSCSGTVSREKSCSETVSKEKSCNETVSKERSINEDARRSKSCEYDCPKKDNGETSKDNDAPHPKKGSPRPGSGRNSSGGKRERSKSVARVTNKTESEKQKPKKFITRTESESIIRTNMYYVPQSKGDFAVISKILKNIKSQQSIDGQLNLENEID